MDVFLSLARLVLLPPLLFFIRNLAGLQVAGIAGRQGGGGLAGWWGGQVGWAGAVLGLPHDQNDSNPIPLFRRQVRGRRPEGRRRRGSRREGQMRAGGRAEPAVRGAPRDHSAGMGQPQETSRQVAKQ